jgi:hypothetical protein
MVPWSFETAGRFDEVVFESQLSLKYLAEHLVHA